MESVIPDLEQIRSGACTPKDFKAKSKVHLTGEHCKLHNSLVKSLATSFRHKLSFLTIVQSKQNSKKASKANVNRLVSWSHYIETTGGERAIESAEEWMIDMSQLFLGQKFASGAYSRLYHGVYKEKSVAVKVIRQPEIDADGTVSSKLDKQFCHEVALLSRLHHCNIVKFVAACKKPPVYCVITEYLPGGSLRAFLHQQEPHSLPLELVRNIALDIARGMEYLHSQGVIHRDLKSENLVLTHDLHAKVADFGVSCLENKSRNTMKGFMATYRWMAPELIKEKPYSRKVDVYSFGVVLWELLTCLIPFEGKTPVQAAFAVAQKNERPAIPANSPTKLSKLMQQCWSTNPEKRPEFTKVVKDLEELENQLVQPIRNNGTRHRMYACLAPMEYMSEA